jgi:hypothetical protein
MAKINNKLMDSASKLITTEVVSKMQESVKYWNDSASKLISKEVSNELGNSLSKFQNYIGNPELNKAIVEFTKKLALNKDFIVNYLKEHKDWKENLKDQYLLKEGKLSVIFQEKKIILADTPNEFLVFWLWYFEEYYGLNIGNFDKYKIKDYDFVLYSEYRKIKMFTTKNSFEAMNDVYTNYDKNNLNKTILIEIVKNRKKQPACKIVLEALNQINMFNNNKILPKRNEFTTDTYYTKIANLIKEKFDLEYSPKTLENNESKFEGYSIDVLNFLKKWDYNIEVTKYQNKNNIR